MKKTTIYILILILIAIIFVIFFVKNNQVSINPPLSKEPIEMCYKYSKETPSGFMDRAWLQMSISGSNITGEYRNLPAETDSKVGKFEGTVGPMDPKISGRIADVWWDSLAEGMEVKEQLNIQFGEGSAVTLFGEMVDRGDGVYVYKDKNNLTPGFQMDQKDCIYLRDEIAVEKYVRDNITNLAPEEAILGGTWYIVEIKINPPQNTGTATYEDGHIQGKMSFTYTRNGENIEINSIKKIEE